MNIVTHKNIKLSRILWQKLYQLIIVRLEGKLINTQKYRDDILALVEDGIGGVIVFGAQITPLKEFIKEIQAAAEIPLIVASDIERGVGQQVQGANHFPGQMALCAALSSGSNEDIALLHDTIDAIICEAIDIGINMPLIPVMDVNLNPSNPIICTRAFSDDPAVVSWYGCQIIERIEKAFLISTAKHFPGHGDTAVDSHITLPIINKSIKQLEGVELVPFKAAIKQGVSAIMAGHLSIPDIDDMPASISKNALTGLLRQGLGFEGLIITDALNMDALNGIGGLPVRCLNAGADIILHPLDAHKTVKELFGAINNGVLTEDVVDRALFRILKVKEKFKYIQPKPLDIQRHATLSNYISGRSITLVNGHHTGFLTKNANLILVGEGEHYEKTLLRGYFNKIYTIADILDQQPLPNEVIVCAVFTSVSAWKGSSGLSDEHIKIIKSLLQNSKSSMVISFGSPYILNSFKEADSLVAAYEPSQGAQIAVIECLKGNITPQGTLPIRLS
ncbi:MAG: hypothetical protein L3V56_05645 [Candidatus Magnetoovum sp. WYHC-5]|nr:hypothetical protein [Candidatus Magnetoovum sp. WYHC-5]